MRPALVLLLFGMILPAGFAALPESGTNWPLADSAVLDVLRTETATLDQAFDRRAALREVLEQSPDLTPARWQAGDVRWNGEWHAATEVPGITRGAALLREYRERRDAALKTAPAQLQLANWCRDAGLNDQEQAHLGAVLLLSPGSDQSAIRQRLGQELVGNLWLNREEVALRDRLVGEAEESRKLWGPRLEKLRARLNGSKRQQEEAIAALEAIDDPSAIAAIRDSLGTGNEREVLLSIGMLQRMPEYEATQALAWQAVASPHFSARRAATEVLRTRRLEHFVPSILSIVATPSESHWAVGFGIGGELYFSHLLVRETEDHWQVSRLRIQDWRFFRQNAWSSGPLPPPSLFSTNNERRLAANDLRDRIAVHDLKKVRQNLLTNQLNDRVGSLLATVAGLEQSTDPRDWWNWWQQYTSREDDEQKLVVIVEEEEVKRLPRPRPRPIILPGRKSCLPAGTLIFTETGFQPVEEIQVGDRVLAKQVETGELSFQPVLLTTLRAATDMLRIELGHEVIEATLGHPFWISGHGWAKADELQPGTPLHTSTGMVRIKSVSAARPAPAHNLVVADAHTYFVGRSLLLTHDNTIPQPTNSVVPGLTFRLAQAHTSGTTTAAAAP